MWLAASSSHTVGILPSFVYRAGVTETRMGQTRTQSDLNCKKKLNPAVERTLLLLIKKPISIPVKEKFTYGNGCQILSKTCIFDSLH